MRIAEIIGAGLPPDAKKTMSGGSRGPNIASIKVDLDGGYVDVKAVLDAFAQCNAELDRIYGFELRLVPVSTHLVSCEIRESTILNPAVIRRRVVASLTRSKSRRADPYPGRSWCELDQRLVEFISRRTIKAVFVETSISERNIWALVEGCANRAAS